MNHSVSFGDRLREERVRLGLTQPQIGEIGGVTKKTQMLYESGQRSPDASYLSAVAAHGIDVMYLLTGQRLPPDNPASPLTAGDRVLLDNFHAAPEQVQAGVKTALGAFAPGGSTDSKKRDRAA